MSLLEGSGTTTMRFMAENGFTEGDRVRMVGGSMEGTVANVVTDTAFSNGGRAMVTVDWDSGARNRVTDRNLEAA